MEVYVVFYDGYEAEVEGVYADKEDAEKAVERLNGPSPTFFDNAFWVEKQVILSSKTRGHCPANYWEPGLGPCVCEGRIHPKG